MSVSGKKAEKSYPFTVDASGEDIFVYGREDEVNVNNIHDDPSVAIYTFMNALANEIYERMTTPPNGVPACSFCYRRFENYSKLESHKSKPCHQDRDYNFESKPIQVIFARSRLPFVQDALFSLRLDLTILKGEKVSFVVEECDLEITMRRLYLAQITKYNLEQWYFSLQKLAHDESIKNDLTPKSIIYKLTHEELKLL